MLNPLTTPKIPLVIVAGPLQASNAVDPIRAFLNGAQQMNDVNLAGAGHQNNFHISRVIQSHGTCQVRGGIPSVLATKSDDGRFEIGHCPSLEMVYASSSNASILHMSCSSS